MDLSGLDRDTVTNWGHWLAGFKPSVTVHTPGPIPFPSDPVSTNPVRPGGGGGSTEAERGRPQQVKAEGTVTDSVRRRVEGSGGGWRMGREVRMEVIRLGKDQVPRGLPGRKEKR